MDSINGMEMEGASIEIFQENEAVVFTDLSSILLFEAAKFYVCGFNNFTTLALITSYLFL